MLYRVLTFFDAILELHKFVLSICVTVNIDKSFEIDARSA